MFDPNKPVQTRDGRKARIICTDALMFHSPTIALVKGPDGWEKIYKYQEDGSLDFADDTGLDLINIEEGEG